MGLGSFLFGKKDKTEQHQLYTPQQQALLNQIIGGLGGQNGAVSGGMDFIQQLLGGQTAETATAPMMREFNEQTVPQLSERFAGADALNSSAFGQSLGSAGAGLQENLYNARNQQQMQGLSGLMQMLSPALSNQFETTVTQGGGGLLGGVLGTGIGGYLGGIGQGAGLKRGLGV